MNKYNKYNTYSSVSNKRPSARPTQQFKGLKAEEYIELGGRYAITINPEDTRDTEKDTIKDYANLREHLNEVCDEHKRNIFGRLKFCELEIYPEISPTGRLHHHAILTVIDTVGFLWHDVQVIRENAQCEIDTIKEMQVWLDYCTKQTHIMKPYLREYPIRIKNYKSELEKGENIQHD